MEIPPSIHIYSDIGLPVTQGLDKLTGSIWLHHQKIGLLHNGIFSPFEHYVEELAYFYRYECTVFPTFTLKCVYYRKIYVNQVETIFNGHLPLHADVIKGWTRLNHLGIQLVETIFNLHVLFLLSLFTPTHVISMHCPNITRVYNEYVAAYIHNISHTILYSPGQLVALDMVTYFLLTHRYKDLSIYTQSHSALIFDCIQTYANHVIPVIPIELCTKLIYYQKKYKPLFTSLGRQYGRNDLTNLSVPSPLREVQSAIQ